MEELATDALGVEVFLVCLLFGESVAWMDELASDVSGVQVFFECRFFGESVACLSTFFLQLPSSFANHLRVS